MGVELFSTKSRIWLLRSLLKTLQIFLRLARNVMYTSQSGVGQCNG